MTLLTKLVAPRFAVEVGTFTCYSPLCIARGLPDGGRLLCCDVSGSAVLGAGGCAQYTFELQVAPAIDTLARPARPTR